MTPPHQLIEFATACNAVSSILLGNIQHLDSVVDSIDSSGKTPRESEALLHDLFSLNIFPYANLFLSRETIAGGEVGQELAEVYQHWHFRPDARDVTADHFGVQFSALEYQLLTAVEHWRHGDTVKSTSALQSINEFIQAILMPALIPFAAALSFRPESLAKNLCQILLTLTSELHRLGNPSNSARPLTQIALPADDASLNVLILYLLSPAASGVWISKSEIRDIAGMLDLPCGFSTREDMLTNLFHSAGSYEQTAKLILALLEKFKNYQIFYENWRTQCGEPIMDCILGRTASTQTLLQSLVTKAGSGDLSK